MQKFELLQNKNFELPESLNKFSFFSNQKVVDLYVGIFNCDIFYALLRNEKEIVALLPVIRTDENNYTSLGHLPEADLFDFLPISYKNESDASELITEFAKFIKEKNLNLQISEIPMKIALSLPRGFHEICDRTTLLPVCNIAQNEDVKSGKLIFKKKYRREIIRKGNKISANHEMRVEHEIDKAKYLESLVNFFANSANKEKQSFFSDNIRDFFKRFVMMEEVKLSGLFFGEKIVSIAIYFDENSTRYLYNMASDISYSEFSPGIVHIHNLVLQTSQDNNFSEFNFLRGAERYKFEIGANSCSANYEIKLEIR